MAWLFAWVWVGCYLVSLCVGNNKPFNCKRYAPVGYYSVLFLYGLRWLGLISGCDSERGVVGGFGVFLGGDG